MYFGDECLPDGGLDLGKLQHPEVYFRSARLETALRRLQAALIEDDPFLSLLGSTLCQLVVVELLARQPGVVGLERQVRGLGPAQLQQVRDLIEGDLRAALTLDDLAAAAGQSKFHFVRAFKSATGMTPYRAFLERRIARAKDMLLSGAAVQDVAQGLGFSSLSEFSRAFKRRTGYAPSKLRKAKALPEA
jgi:AraC family transcriptional regulator